MTLTINLSPQDEATYAASVLRHDLESSSVDQEPAEGETLADLLEGYIGTMNSSAAHNGRLSKYARNSEAEVGKIMDEKKRQGPYMTFTEGSATG